MKRIIWMGVTAAVVLWSVNACGDGSTAKETSTEQQEQSNGVQRKEDRQAEIMQMEQEIGRLANKDKNPTLDRKAEILLLRYRDYISVNPRDSMSAEYLFKAADLSLGVNKPKASIAYLDRLIQDFPDFRKGPEMMLFRGFIYEAHLKQHAEAVKAYEAMIKRYPNHRLAEDARASIANLTMSEEELIEKFKQQNAAGEKAS